MAENASPPEEPYDEIECDCEDCKPTGVIIMNYFFYVIKTSKSHGKHFQPSLIFVSNTYMILLKLTKLDKYTQVD
jgi:hypothetical protein